MRFFGNKPQASRILGVVAGFPASGQRSAPQDGSSFTLRSISMKKLFALVALVGMGAFLAGCGEDPKTPPAKTPAGGMTGPGAVQSGPKADGVKGKTDGDKEDMDKDEGAKDDKG